MIRKILISIVLLTSLLFATVSCKKYLDVNKNVDAPAQIDGYLYLAGILQAYQGNYYDVRATAPLTQMMGTTSFTVFAQNYYSEGSDNGGELWRMTYWLQGMNLENMINQSVAKEDWTLAGIGYAIKAYSWDQLTKEYGELPLKQAFVPGLLSFNYDYQDTIYAQVRRWAYMAIDYLGRTDNHIYGTKISANDWVYGTYADEKAKWTKFAYGVIVRNLASLSNKTNFVTDYAPELITAAGKSFTSFADDATVKVAGGSTSAPQTAYNNFWGTVRLNLSYSYFQHEYAVQVMTGSVPQYDVTTGNKLIAAPVNAYYPYQLAATQIICDTVIMTPGHYDPRMAVKLSTIDDPSYNSMSNVYNIKKRKYYGGSFTGASGPIGTAPSYYGRTAVSVNTGTLQDGKGRWLYRDDAPYILMTYAELQFDLAEAYWKMGQTANALTAFKAGVSADMDFTANYISSGTAGATLGGDKITKAVFQTIAAEYLAGPYVNGMTVANLTLSHIMMQKWVALYPWGSQEAWVDMRKYNYDIAYTGDHPASGNGWTLSSLTQKWDTDPTKVYKGFYLAPAQVQARLGTYNVKNAGAPEYRLRPRYNSEYMWNKPALASLLPIAGTADNYQCSIPWFAYPGAMPTSK
jgi:hypothetical protein